MASTLLFIGIFVLDFITFAVALLAEQMKSAAIIVVDSESNYRYCSYEPNFATYLGITASVLLLASQVFTTVTTQCFSSGKSFSPAGFRTCRIFLSIICWVTFFIAEALLLMGSVKNSHQTKYRTIVGMDPPYCQTLRKGVFEAGAAFVMVTSILSKINYICYSKTEDCFDTDKNGSNELGAYTSI